MPSSFQKTILITGGTTGLGYHCALILARKYPKYQIIVASRTDRGRSADRINSILKQDNVRYMHLDLSSLAEVRSFAAAWAEKQFPPIQVLLLNAGLQIKNGIAYTVDGFEKTFAVNHIGHALLFGLLMPHLVENARVVITSSGTHDPAQKTGLPDAKYISAEELAHPSPESVKQNDGRQRYASSKLVNVLWMYALHRRLQGLKENKWTFLAMDPGLMPGTGLARDYNVVLRFFWLRVMPNILPLMRMLISPNIHSPQESAEALARLASDPDMEGISGKYFEGMSDIKSSEDSYNETKQEDLWAWTVKTVSKDVEEAKRFGIV
jgi:NAD(P)-dependent dehydrogenase (short-subunit alcohol dehydrogenase family)